jgi:DNA invertase Pin-like site-specific DNA recombinase
MILDGRKTVEYRSWRCGHRGHDEDAYSNSTGSGADQSSAQNESGRGSSNIMADPQSHRRVSETPEEQKTEDEVNKGNPNLRAAIYARVSTVNAGQDPAMKARELEEYCQRRGWQVYGTYVDNGVSGKKDSRPQLNRMIQQDAHERRFDVVVVWRFDRFVRSVSHLLRALENFNGLGIEFVSLSEQVDTSTPTGRMVFTVLGAVAELERNLIVERVRAGLRHAKSKGNQLGRPKKSIDADTIATMRKAGSSWRAIARNLGVSVGTAFAAARGNAGSEKSA